MKCLECSQEIKYEQSYFVVVGRDSIRFHHVCYIYMKPRRIMQLTGTVIPQVLLKNDKEDNNFIPNQRMIVDCSDAMCDYQEPHEHGFACGDNCPCGLQMKKE